jgi:hypothetical protein
MRDDVTLQLDHVFIMCAAGAPEAVALARLGLTEGSSNTHPGQGTACRRFFFQNQYLELLWVCDRDEALNEATQHTRLWERWSARQHGACPFGIVLRARDDRESQLPFPTLPYAPAYLPNEFKIAIAMETPLTEPEFFVVRFPRGHAPAAQGPHPGAIRLKEVTNVRIGTRVARPFSLAARWAESSGLLSFERSDQYVLRMTFDRGVSGQGVDFRPELPLAFRW